MTSVEITGFSRVMRPKPNQGGSTILAYFDLNVAGVSMLGCAFVRTKAGGLTVWPPKLETEALVGRRAVSFVDGQLRAELVRQAQLTYRMLGGTDGEWCRYGETPEDAAARVARANGTHPRLNASIVDEEEDDDAEGLLRVLAKG